jgi:hypothetical protein
MALEPSELEKWTKEVELREREIAVKEFEAEIKKREAVLKNRELQLKVFELKRSRLTNPLFLAIVGAIVAGAGTAIGAGIAAWAQIRLEQTKSIAQQDIERFKADSTLVLEVIKTNNDTEKARANLKFLLGTGLITDKTRRDELATYLQGAGPVATLPAAVPRVDSSQNVGVTCRMPLTADIPKVSAEIEKEWRANPNFSNIAVTVGPNSATITAEMQIAGITGLGMRATATIRQTSSAVIVTVTREIPGTLEVLLGPISPVIFKGVAETYTKILERVGVGGVVCVERW